MEVKQLYTTATIRQMNIDSTWIAELTDQANKIAAVGFGETMLEAVDSMVSAYELKLKARGIEAARPDGQ